MDILFKYAIGLGLFLALTSIFSCAYKEVQDAKHRKKHPLVNKHGQAILVFGDLRNLNEWLVEHPDVRIVNATRSSGGVFTLLVESRVEQASPEPAIHVTPVADAIDDGEEF